MRNRITIIEQTEKTITQSITCDICKKTYSLVDDPMEVQEFYSFCNVGGYGGSIWGWRVG
jgi:hypothetical protein